VDDWRTSNILGICGRSNFRSTSVGILVAHVRIRTKKLELLPSEEKLDAHSRSGLVGREQGICNDIHITIAKLVGPPRIG